MHTQPITTRPWSYATKPSAGVIKIIRSGDCCTAAEFSTWKMASAYLIKLRQNYADKGLKPPVFVPWDKVARWEQTSDSTPLITDKYSAALGS